VLTQPLSEEFLKGYPMTINTIFNTDNIPGTILKDMNTFLHYIRENELEITGNKGLLPNHCLPKININMSHPLKLALKREQQISYPHISALYLLSRSLGFIQLIQNKSKRFLTINAEMISEWNKLNEVEKYFGLMQAWFFRCDERLINQGKHHWFSGIFGPVYRFVRDDLKNDMKFKDEKERTWKLYMIKLYNLALLEMFGLVKVKDNDTSIEKSWPIANISLSDFGIKWIQLLEKTNCEQLIFLMDEENIEAMKQFYQKFSPFAPQWKTCIELQKKTTDKRVHIFKVSLTKKTWRRISISGTESLDDLSNFILDAFEFDHDHLYQFTYTDRFGSLKTINDYRCNEPPYSDEVKVGDIDILVGDSIEFLFDFSDSWLFDVQLEKIDDSLKNNDKPVIIESIGEAPEQYPAYEDY
jgi:hypothetical protein